MYTIVLLAALQTRTLLVALEVLVRGSALR